MNKISLHNFFNISSATIYSLILEPKILSFQILYLYFFIKDWYVKNKIRNIILFDELINNKNIYNNIIDVSEIDNLTQYSYVALIDKVSRTISNNLEQSCLEYIDYLHKNGKYYYAIYISNITNIYIIFLYKTYNIILLINIANLDIIEFKKIEECIYYVNRITSNNYYYQFLRIIHRSYKFRNISLNIRPVRNLNER